ncbi:MAG: hypothetical protein HY272_10560 [Gammaproteobacteria bacterium]|nr:hypothetical protein [Gammaproteobacteria bacterium]
MRFNLINIEITPKWNAFWRISLAGTLAALLAACGSGNPDANVAQKVVEEFYQAQLSKDDNKVLGLYSSKRALDERKSYVEQQHKTLGQLKSYHIKRNEVNTVLRGRYYIFDIQAEYDQAGVVQETLTIFNEVGSEETSIVGHNISSERVALNF